MKYSLLLLLFLNLSEGVTLLPSLFFYNTKYTQFPSCFLIFPFLSLLLTPFPSLYCSFNPIINTSNTPCLPLETELLVYHFSLLVHPSTNLSVMSLLQTCNHSHPLPKTKFLILKCKILLHLALIFLSSTYHSIACTLFSAQTKQGTLPQCTPPLPVSHHLPERRLSATTTSIHCANIYCEPRIIGSQKQTLFTKSWCLQLSKGDWKLPNNMQLTQLRKLQDTERKRPFQACLCPGP